MVPLDQLKRHSKNYKTHPDDQLEHLAASIERNGVYRNVVVARDGTILAGHGVVDALGKLGRTHAPAVRLDLDADDPRAIAVMVGDNEIAHLGENDDRALSELLKNILDAPDVGLLGTGYDEAMLASLVMVTRPASEIKSFDEAAEWVGMPAYDPSEETTKMVVAFRTAEDRDAFVEQSGVGVLKRESATWSAWWPPREREDPSSLRLSDGA